MRSQINEILKYLSTEDQKAFLNELLNVVRIGKRKKNFDDINRCIESWEATAELNSIPGFQKRVVKKIVKLKKAGVING